MRSRDFQAFSIMLLNFVFILSSASRLYIPPFPFIEFLFPSLVGVFRTRLGICQKINVYEATKNVNGSGG